MKSRPSDLWSRERAVSSTVGFVLVFALVAFGMTVTVAIGQGAIAEAEQQLAIDRSEQSLTQLDSQATHVALGRSDVQSIDLGAGAGQYVVDESAGRMTVDVNSHDVLDTDMGALVYEEGETTIAYQGGGVWRKTGADGDSMVSPPEFHYRDETLTLPLVVVKGDGSVGDRIHMKEGARTQNYPDQIAGLTNPVASGTVNVTVQSEYADAWGRYFETRTDGNVTKLGPNTVELELDVPTNNPTISGAVVGQSPGHMDLKGQTDFNAYNSDTDSPPFTYSNDVDAYIKGNAELKSGGEIHGDLYVGGDVVVKGRVHGTTHHGGSYEEKAGGSSAATSSGASIPNPTNVNSMISAKSYTNPSGASSTISKIENGNCPKSPDWCELDAGSYELNRIQLDSDQRLKFDTTGGPINIKVKSGGIEANSDADITVEGNNRVNIYNAGDAEFKSRATVWNDGHDSPQFWLYMRDDSTADLKAGTEFTGVIYAPGQSGGGTIKIKSNGDIWGALVGDVNDVKAGKNIHYDKALSSMDPIPPSGSTVRITYLHVSTNEVEVSD